MATAAPDVAIFRPSTDTWSVLTSSTNYVKSINRQWGTTGDQAIPGPDTADPIANLKGTITNPLGSANVTGVQYKSFLGNPLFASDGPLPTDVAQGQIGDCQTMAVLVGIAKNDPGLLRRMIFDMGNGLYAVDFKPLGIAQYVVVNATLPVDANGVPLYAKLGHQGSLWVALIEKAWTFERPTGGTWNSSYQGTYHNIDGGGSNEILTQENITSNVLNSTPAALWAATVADFQAGKMVTISTGSTAASGVIANHYYYVDQVFYTVIGTTKVATSLVVRNPWGGDQEFVSMTIGQFGLSVTGEISAFV